MTFFMFITIQIFHYLHPHGHDRLLKSFELDQCFCGLMAIYSYGWEFGRQVKSSPQQTGLLLVWEAEGSDLVTFHIFAKSHFELFFAPCLASSCLICMAARNFWISPAECELLYSALGTGCCYFRRLVPEHHLRWGLDIEKDMTTCYSRVHSQLPGVSR